MAISGAGTELRRWDDTLKIWEAQPEINSITGPTITVSTIDTTALDTPGAYRTFIAGFIDGGDVTLEMNFTRNAFETFLSDLNARALVSYELIIPDADNTSIEFDALVTGVPVTIPTDEKVTFTATLKISGEPTIESGSGPSAGA